MKRMKKLFCLAVLAAMTLGMSVHAFAAGDPYTYTVRVFPGNNGSGSYENAEFSGETPGRVAITVTDGRTLQVNGETYITLSNDRYYIQGVRIAGQDAVVSAPSLGSLSGVRS